MSMGQQLRRTIAKSAGAGVRIIPTEYRCRWSSSTSELHCTVRCFLILRIVLRITHVQSITNSYPQYLHDCLQNNLIKHKHCGGLTNLETICKRTNTCLDASLNDSNLSHDWNVPDIYCKWLSQIAQDTDTGSFYGQSRRLSAGSIEGLFESLAAEQLCCRV